jgi:histidine triad (HIT) family protein
MTTESIHTSPHGCVFCELPMMDRHRDLGLIVNIEPLNPVVPGHRIFIPPESAGHAAEDPKITGEVFADTARWGAIQTRDPEHPQAFNLIVNSGRAATQSIDHLHVHYVPRAEGDGLTLPWTGQALPRKTSTGQ